jgi:hypothetical protein
VAQRELNAIVCGWSAEVRVILKPLAAAGKAAVPWRTRQGQCRPLPVRRLAAIEKCLRGCATAWERSGQSYGLKELGRREDLGGWLRVLVPNFTEERVKRFARILESNESLIDDLLQLAV